MSKVDVVVPCYNYGHFLTDCIKSVLNQSADVRVLIIDDASVDNSADVGAALATQDDRVSFRRHRVNRGHIETYNEGLLEWATAEYSLLLSADDQLTPGSLSRAIQLMDAHAQVGFTYGRVIKFHSEDLVDWNIPDNYDWNIIPGRAFLELCCTGNSCGENIVPTPTAVVRTSLQKKLGGYRKELPHAGDMEMWLRFAAHAYVGKLEVEQAYYRYHTANMFRKYLGIADILQRKAAFDAVFEAHGHLIEDAGSIRRVANRRIAEAAFWLGSTLFDQGEHERCQELLDVALEIDPELRYWSGWHRLRIKRCLGTTAWSIMSPVVKKLRFRTRTTLTRSKEAR